MAFIAEGQNEVSMERANKQEESINSCLNNIHKNVTRNGSALFCYSIPLPFQKFPSVPQRNQ